jgi:hypothetical protein
VGLAYHGASEYGNFPCPGDIARSRTGKRYAARRNWDSEAQQRAPRAIANTDPVEVEAAMRAHRHGTIRVLPMVARIRSELFIASRRSVYNQGRPQAVQIREKILASMGRTTQ